MRRRVDMVLVLRKAHELGAQVALVTRDRVVKGFARENGIPIFKSAKAAQGTDWQMAFSSPVALPPDWKPVEASALRAEGARYHQPSTGILETPGVRLVLFFAGVLAVLAMAFFFFPSAQVTFKPDHKIQSFDLAVWASPNLPSANPSGGVPVYEIKVEVEGRQVADSTGTALIPNSYAAGTVQFTNLTDKAVDLPAGTILRSLADRPVRFLTTQSIVLPAGPGKTANVDVKAEEPGVDGNVPAGKIQAVEGGVGLNVSVTNPDAIQGGSTLTAKAPSPADYRQIKGAVLESLRQAALKDATRLLQPGQELIPVSLTVKNILLESYSPSQGQAADRLTISIRAEYSVWYVKTDDLNTIVMAGLAANMASGYRPIAGTQSLQNRSEPRMDAGDTARWQIHADRELEPNWSPEQIAAALRGRTRAEAVRIIKATVPVQGEPQIVLSPSWWARLPYLPFRIEVSQQ